MLHIETKHNENRRPADRLQIMMYEQKERGGTGSSRLATCEGRVLAEGVPDEGALGAPHSQQAGGGGVEEDQLQPALRWLQGQLRRVGLLRLGLTQTPQLHLNTRRRVNSEVSGRIEESPKP